MRYIILLFYQFARSANFSYLVIGYLKCGIFVQSTENKPLPSRYLFSYAKMQQPYKSSYYITSIPNPKGRGLSLWDFRC